jgi:predicted TIM-barrel fold metal-dependent hydrolase
LRRSRSTAWSGRRGYDLDDPAIGLPVIEHARSLGVRIMCAHKGLPLLEFDRSHNGPRDLVSAAAQYPDVQFVVYHSAFERRPLRDPTTRRARRRA